MTKAFQAYFQVEKNRSDGAPLGAPVEMLGYSLLLQSVQGVIFMIWYHYFVRTYLRGNI
jgi:hypothetical protein